MQQKLSKIFNKVFGEGATPASGDTLEYFFAPGRVNLIGEHTDYNGGFVFPCALSVGTYMVVRKRGDDVIRVYSENFPEAGTVVFSLNDLEKNDEHDWANYPKGVIDTMRKHGFQGIHGFDAVFFGNIPNGAGLSSSASIELVTAVAWDELNGFSVDRVELIKMCQEAENQYIGVNCGVMDQFAIGKGRAEHAILLDCNSLEYEYAPVELDGVKLVIANTNKRRGLADSKYNERRSECEEALHDLQTVANLSYLCELTPEEFDNVENIIKNPVARKRAKHAIYEHDRTKRAARKLKEKDVVAFGKLMNESHVSLKEDYEVTGEHLDALVEAAWKEEAVLGARMTGAGFGGCTVNLIREGNLVEVLGRIRQRYEAAVGLTPEFYIVEIGTGAQKLP
ncbi:galactokinase [Evansella caseinilytica]|uniref:Galactokinase n=1 Tax=Evansella caseinilytica TaxID=1503961 RepID=A0A1H3QGV5_9BACI|nr:galactokinase [Evansella caseinilytica]SDZ11939.1 galactokinase [Evansella caseinilytica]